MLCKKSGDVAIGAVTVPIRILNEMLALCGAYDSST